MKIMVNHTTRAGGLLLFLVALAVLTGCQPGPTKVQEAHNIEEPRQNAEQVDTAEVTSPPAKPGSTAAKVDNKGECKKVEDLTRICSECEKAEHPDSVVCLTAQEMRDHVVHIEPLKRPGMADPRSRMRGIVRLGVRFDPAGKASRAYIIKDKGQNPLAVSVALDAMKKWTFKPIVKKGEKRSGCGIVTIKYDFRNGEGSTELQ